MRCCRRASTLWLIAIWPWLLPAVVLGQGSDGTDNIVDTTTVAEKSVYSSPFELTLYPSVQELDVSGSSEVQNAIKSAILLSSSITTSFTSVSEVEALLHQVEYEENSEFGGEHSVPVSHVEFEILMTFSFNVSKNATLPSRYSLDNLIARAFSQPSSKSTFIAMLGLARDPMLNEVQDIKINLVENSTSPPAVSQGSSLSAIDVVLIVLSLLVFFGILYAIYHYHMSRSKLEKTRSSSIYTKETKSMVASSLDMKNNDGFLHFNQNSVTDHEEESTDIHADPELRGDTHIDYHEHTSGMMAIGGNITIAEAASFESSDERKSQLIVPSEEFLEMHDDSSSDEQGDMFESSSSSSDSSDDDSTSAASSSSSYSGNQESADHTSESPQLLGAKQPDYRRKPRVKLDDKLLSLPGGSAFELSDMNTASRSCDSAPPILEHDSGGSKITFAFRDEKSAESARSVSSSESETSSQRDDENSVSIHRRRQGGNGTIAISDSSNRLETAEQFNNNWLESKRKAEDDIEEGSTEDVFQVGIQRTAALDERQKRNSGATLRISEFLNSVQVVGSALETQSSAEHSSTELKSLYSNLDINSADLSLEQSMAESIVEI
jgi:hypothetical protein